MLLELLIGILMVSSFSDDTVSDQHSFFLANSFSDDMVSDHQLMSVQSQIIQVA